MYNIPSDIIYQLAILLDYDSLRNYWSINHQCKEIASQPVFWYDMQIEQKEWNEVIADTKSAREAYIRLAAEFSCPFWGAEKYGDIDLLAEEAARTNDFLLIDHFYELSQYYRVLYILAKRNKLDYFSIPKLGRR